VQQRKVHTYSTCGRVAKVMVHLNIRIACLTRLYMYCGLVACFGPYQQDFKTDRTGGPYYIRNFDLINFGLIIFISVIDGLQNNTH
jgi:hypothetical protein